MLKKCDFEEYLIFLKKSFLLISQEDAEKEHFFIVMMKNKFSKIKRVYCFVYVLRSSHSYTFSCEKDVCNVQR